MAKKRSPQRKVGYKKPPSTSRFRPGQSGNPNGRPRGSKNLSTVIEKELDNRIGVTEDGMRKTITKRVAAIKQLVNKAVSGDAKAIALLLKTGLERAEEPAEKANAIGPTDQRLMDSIIRRIRQADPPAAETDTNSDPEKTD